MPRPEVVLTFRGSLATIKRWLARRRTGTDLTPTSPPGRRRRITAEQQAALVAQLAAPPDATIAWHTQRWNESQGVTVSQWTVGRAIRGLGWTYKKRRWVRPNGMNRPGQPTVSASSTGGLLTS